MIENSNEFMTVMFNLKTTRKFRFELTGSQHFKGAENSDWDFFTEDKKGVRDFLTDLGFVEIMEAYPKDPLTVSVMRFVPPKVRNSIRNFHKSQNIDVQIVSDFEMKLAAQTLITENALLHVMIYSKHRINSMWNLLYNALTAGKNLK